MDKTELFLEKFKLLEDAVRNKYHLRDGDSITYYLSGQSKYKKFADELNYCQKVRNFLVHECKLGDEFAVTPGDAMIRFVEDLTQIVIDQPRCCDVHVKLGQVYWRSMQDSVKTAMAVMRERMFTHVPILDEGGAVIGVFDENSIFTYLAERNTVSIANDLRFADISKHLSLTGREMESFIFVKPDMLVEELEDIVEKAFIKGDRIALAFVTASGKPDDRLQGIITPWASIKVNDNN